MIIRHMLFILNSEFSVSDELFENAMIIIKNDKDIGAVYCATECVTTLEIECGDSFLFSDKHFYCRCYKSWRRHHR